MGSVSANKKVKASQRLLSKSGKYKQAHHITHLLKMEHNIAYFGLKQMLRATTINRDSIAAVVANELIRTLPMQKKNIPMASLQSR